MDKNRKILYLATVASLFFTRTSAQIVNNEDSLVGKAFSGTVGNYFSFDQGMRDLFFDGAMFVFAWLFAYAMFAVLLKLIEDNAPGDTGDTLKEVLMGDANSNFGSASSRNLLIPLTFLMLLSLGPYLGPLLSDMRSLLIGGAASTFLIVLISLVVLFLLGLMYALGLLGQGAAGAGNSFATGANKVANSRPAQWGERAGKEAAKRARIYASNWGGAPKKSIQRYAELANNMGYLVCDECGRWYDPSNASRGDDCKDAVKSANTWCQNGEIGAV